MTRAHESSRLSTHWSRPHLVETLLEAVARAGLDLGTATPDDLAPLDQFHGGGKEATRTLADQAGVTAGMRVLDVAAGTTRQVTFGPSSHSSGAYSPDGKRIAMMRADPGKKADVWVLGPGKKRVWITDSGPEFGTPAWSPDGRRLLFQMPTANGARLFTAPSDGSGAPVRMEFR